MLLYTVLPRVCVYVLLLGVPSAIVSCILGLLCAALLNVRRGILPTPCAFFLDVLYVVPLHAPHDKIDNVF